MFKKRGKIMADEKTIITNKKELKEEVAGDRIRYTSDKDAGLPPGREDEGPEPTAKPETHRPDAPSVPTGTGNVETGGTVTPEKASEAPSAPKTPSPIPMPKSAAGKDTGTKETGTITGETGTGAEETRTVAGETETSQAQKADNPSSRTDTPSAAVNPDNTAASGETDGAGGAGPDSELELEAGAGLGTGSVKEERSEAEKEQAKKIEEARKAKKGKGEKEGFYIDLRPKVIKLPPFKDKREIDVRYPLIPPFAYAHIFWDKKENELVYNIEEPVLDDTERELLELVQLGLEEMINISFVKAARSNILIQYLEKNVQSILIELGTKISKATYKKLMYYIYRNSVGLNEIEPLLNDYYVEDIECNGINFPLYIVHRAYQNLRTNVKFVSPNYLTDFVEKLAQKSGRYISYAKPLLDGTLPDGSRVNATYTEDITTRGPTFTIRKFTKEPWSPIHLVKNNTSAARTFAYIWLAIEHKFNVMTIGETASGKTTFLNCIAAFIPPEARIVSIEDTRELNLAHINWLPSVTRSGFGMPNVLGEQFGEISLFDLLKESFRQNPDYVIVGEIRGKEAYVLFQGMASGHPSFSTFHAASVETLVKRLETPPINLSPSLVESLDVVCINVHVKDSKRNFRRLKEVDEITKVEQSLGTVDYNAVFKWDPLKDKHNMTKKPKIFERIKARTGLSMEQINKELEVRTKVLQYMADNDIINFKDFAKVINDYYKNPSMVLKQFKLG